MLEISGPEPNAFEAKAITQKYEACNSFVSLRVTLQSKDLHEKLTVAQMLNEFYSVL
jgi:hypothetical protein